MSAIVLCGSITQNTSIMTDFYVTCDVDIQEGVTLELVGWGYADPGTSIYVRGSLLLSAEITVNVTGERWDGVFVYSTGRIQADWFSLLHAYEGIVLSDSSDNLIRNGQLHDIEDPFGTLHTGDAVGIYGGSNNTVENVQVDKAHWGVYIGDYATGNVVRESSFNSVTYGVGLEYTTDNTVICNDFSDNSYHVLSIFGQNSNNLIHHNNFVAAGSVLDESPNNIFDAGYPEGGNYWHDYVGNDSFRGPNQDFLGGDGIGDEPYNVPSLYPDIFDHYPFMNPVPSSACPSPPPEMPLGPLPPYGISAVLEGASFSDVNITWDLSWDDGSPSFQNYAIYHSQSYNSDKSGYDFLAEVPAGINYFIHSGAGHGNPSNHFYYVQSNDTSGFPGVSSSQVGKYTRSVQEGLNLISVPLVLENRSYASVVQTVAGEFIRAHNATTGEWEAYSPLKPYENPLSLSNTQGYWLNVSEAGIMTIAGVVPETTEIQLNIGWNLVGFPALSNQTLSSALSGIPYETVEGYDPTSNPYLLRTLSPGDVMSAGNAYWIKVSSPCTWTVSN